jgi:hypothetical protein
MLTGNKLITPQFLKLFWSYEKASPQIPQKKMDDLKLVEEAIAVDYKSRRIVYHKRYQGIQPITKYRKRI